jgi:hypothetical protein
MVISTPHPAGQIPQSPFFIFLSAMVKPFLRSVAKATHIGKTLSILSDEYFNRRAAIPGSLAKRVVGVNADPTKEWIV